MKKLFALILAVLMVASLVACAPVAPQTTTAPKATQPAATQPAGTTAPAATTEAPVDLEAFPWVEPGSVKLVLGIPQNSTVLDYEDNYLTKYLEEKTGIDIEFMFFSSNANECAQQINLMVAGKEKLPDMLAGLLTQAQIRELGEEGFLLDLAPLFEQGLNVYSKKVHDNLPADVAAVLWSTATSEDGGIYGFPTVSGTGTIDAMVFAGYINKTFAKNVGINADDIDTVQELHDYLAAIIEKDGNGNGKKDEIGMLGCMKNNVNKVELHVINAYVQFQEKFIYNVTGGEVWSPLNTDEYRQALITLNQWYKEGLISPLSYSLASHPEMKAMIETDPYTVGVWYGHPTTIVSADREIALDYQAMPPLKDETGKGGYGLLIETTKVDMKCAISATCEYPELAFRLFDLFTEKYTAKVMRYGEEGVNWELLDMEESAKNGVYDKNGKPAGWRSLKDEWSEETKVNWHNGILTAEGAPDMVGIGASYGGAAVKETPNLRNTLSRDVYNLCVAVGEPEEVIKALAYNDEEQAVVDQYEKGLKAFFKEARAEFVTGVRDPNSDADWEAYLKELELNGHSELMEAKQTAYERLMSFAG